MNTIRGHKGQNSTGTRCRGFLALESRCRGFLVLESRCRDFLFSEKTPWNHDVLAYLSLFLDVVVFWSSNLDVVAFWSWNLNVVVFWSWNLNIMAFWSWNLDAVVYVPPRPRFRYHRENKKITHIISRMSIVLLKNTSVVQIYATSICIMMHQRIRIMNRIL